MADPSAPYPIPTVTTPRLCLRPFAAEDGEALHRILSTGDVLRYFPNPGPPDRDRVDRLIQRQLAHWADRRYGWWAVEQRAQPGLMGWVGLQFLPETGEVEVGYLLGRDYWGHGYATEGARASLAFGFAGFDLQKIVGIVHPENAASIRVLEKSRMTLDGCASYFGMDVLHYTIERAAYVAAFMETDAARRG